MTKELRERPKGKVGERGPIGEIGQMEIKGKKGVKGHFGDPGPQGENGTVHSTNWKQCVWNRLDHTDTGLLKVLYTRCQMYTHRIILNCFALGIRKRFYKASLL